MYGSPDPIEQELSDLYPSCAVTRAMAKQAMLTENQSDVDLTDSFISQSFKNEGGAMALGKLPVPGRPTVWMIVGQGLIVLAVGADGGCLDIFTLFYPFSPLPPFLWETARYRLKYCLKGPLNPKQPTNQPKTTNQPTN